MINEPVHGRNRVHDQSCITDDETCPLSRTWRSSWPDPCVWG